MAESGIMQGTLDVIVLKAVSWGPRHGYAITRWVRQTTEGALDIEEGALYPALHRLERQGWVDAEWKLSDNNQRAKYYRITAAGRRQLAVERTRWSRLSAAIAKVLGPA